MNAMDAYHLVGRKIENGESDKATSMLSHKLTKILLDLKDLKNIQDQ
jgi:hypothetical protein